MESATGEAEIDPLGAGVSVADLASISPVSSQPSSSRHTSSLSFRELAASASAQLSAADQRARPALQIQHSHEEDRMPRPPFVYCNPLGRRHARNGLHQDLGAARRLPCPSRTARGVSRTCCSRHPSSDANASLPSQWFLPWLRLPDLVSLPPAYALSSLPKQRRRLRRAALTPSFRSQLLVHSFRDSEAHGRLLPCERRLLNLLPMALFRLGTLAAQSPLRHLIAGPLCSFAQR